jgi:TolB-like protein
MKRLLIAAGVTLTLPWMATAFVHADPLQAVAKHLLKGLSRAPSKRIAVLSFPYHNGDESSGSSLVAERLTTLFVESGRAEVVERALLDKAMGEIRLGLTGALDPATGQKLGKTLGVSAIVTGTLIDLEEGMTEVNARLIQTESGAILAATRTRIERTWTDLPRRVFAPVVERSEDQETTVHASQLIPVSSPRRRRPPPVYSGPMQPLEPETASAAGQDILTLTNDDLVPLNFHGNTNPESIVNEFMSDAAAPPADAVHMARRIYHRNADPRVRGRALIAMGHLFERSGRPRMAARAYEQVLHEFPDVPGLQSEARLRLDHVAVK